MENPKELGRLFTFKYLKDFIKGITAMDVDGQLVFFGELDLPAEGDFLDIKRRLVPIQIDANFSDGVKLSSSEFGLDKIQFGLKGFGLNISWVQPHHQENIFGILFLERVHVLGILRIDGRTKKPRNASCYGALDHLVTIV
jgi:hypothetical protein